MTFTLGFITGWLTTSIVTLFAIAGMLSGKRADEQERTFLQRQRRNLYSMFGLPETKTGDVSEPSSNTRRGVRL